MLESLAESLGVSVSLRWLTRAPQTAQACSPPLLLAAVLANRSGVPYNHFSTSFTGVPLSSFLQQLAGAASLRRAAFARLPLDRPWAPQRFLPAGRKHYCDMVHRRLGRQGQDGQANAVDRLRGGDGPSRSQVSPLVFGGREGEVSSEKLPLLFDRATSASGGALRDVMRRVRAEPRLSHSTVTSCDTWRATMWSTLRLPVRRWCW